MSYKNSTKRLIASIALVSQLVYTVNPFVYAFFYYSMSQRALAQETQVTETSNETPSSSETEETTSTASEEVNSENSEEHANTQEKPVVNEGSDVNAANSVEETETIITDDSETELVLEEPVQDDLNAANEEQVAETTSETESNTEPTSENEPQVEGEILGEGASSVRTESEPSDFIEAKEQVNGMECINPDSEIVSSTEEMWRLDSSKDVVETKEVVKAGVKYEFPLNTDVSVTFTCLPKNVDSVSTLKIERIHVSELNLPEGIYPADEYAYDITTDMENGTFEYDLTLPSTELNKSKVVLNYVEKNPSEKIESSDLKPIDSSNIEYSSRKMEVSELDHFTLFVKTYIDLLFTVEGTSFAIGAAVAIKAGDLLANKYYRLSIKPSGGSRTYINSCATGSTTMSYVYNLATNATIGTGWEVGIHQFDDNSACGSSTVSSPLLTQQFAVTAIPTISWPSTWTTPGTCVSDPLNDENPASTDLYGVTGTPAVGFNTDSNNYFFRERVNSNPLDNKGGWDQYAWVVLFQFSAGPYTYLASLNGKDDLVQLYKNTSPAGIVDFDPLLNDPAETLMWEAPASIYARAVNAGGGYYFVDWALPKALLEGLDITTDTTKFFATSANANNYNKDHLQCYRILSDLSIVKTDSADPVYAGATLGYTLTVTNNGPDTAKSVVVTDTLPAGYSVTSVTPSVGSCSDTSAPSIQCELGDMVNGASATITIAGTAPSTAGTITNNTSVSCDTTLCTDTNQTNNTDSEDTTVLEAQGTLIVKKVVTNNNGGTKTYSDFSFKVNNGSSVIFDADGQNDLTVAAGTYTVVETAVSGYTTTYDNCTDVVVALDSTETCVITNTIQPAKITIEKQTLPDGHQETFEFTGDLSGFISDGQTLSSSDLAAGAYTVTEVAEEGWDLTGVSCTDADSTYDLDKGQITFNVDWDEDVTCTVTNTQRGSISGTKYEYLGEEVESETLGDWTINLSGSDWELLTSTTTSNVDGSYQFANLVPGDYYVCENNPEGWKQLTPSTGSTRPETTQICYSVSVEAGEAEVEIDFENAKLSDVHGYKWEDLDQDGYRDVCDLREGRTIQLDEECVPEPLLSGWRIFIDENKDGIYQPGDNETQGEPSMLTDDSEEHFGWYWFEDLMPGEYQICEVLESEWIQTYPYQSTEAYCHTVNLPDDTSEQTLNAVLAPEYNFGNYHELPTLLISKFNNKEGVDLRIGDEITYTIQVTVEEATAGNVKVTDLLPKGVEYKGSSWTATSTVRGDISGLGEPTYNSPGVWTLGDMIPEEIVTLTYTGIVENGTGDGIYKDLAWAKATVQNILALAEEDGNKIATNFVGTEIEVVSDPVEEDLKVDIGEDEKVEEVGEVLGASTSLPATGSATVLLIALLIGLITGLAMIVYSRNKRVLLSLVMFGLVLIPSRVAYAEGENLFVRLEEPNANQTTTFDISFVALDSNNDPIEIVCWKKGPSDGAFVTFGSPIMLNNGGDTGVCSVTNSVLTSDGSYQFKVSAETQPANPADSVTKESDSVSVSYDGTRPGKPFDIEKERDNSCQFELSFKTADDGQTAYVEIYRDDEREFTASPSKLHKTIVIGPDSSYTFEDDLYGSECGKTFYYGIRAFDSLGNGSEIGEEEDTEKTIKITKTTTETKEETGAVLGSGGSVGSGTESGDNSTEVVLPGDILGESNTAENPESSDGTFGTVFGGALDALKNPKILLLILAALLLVGYGIYRARKNR